MLNCYDIVLEIAKVIFNIEDESKWKRVNCDYYIEKGKLESLTKITTMWTDKIVENGKINNNDSGTITEYFFFSLELAHFSLIPIIKICKELNDAISKLESHLKKL